MTSSFPASTYAGSSSSWLKPDTGQLCSMNYLQYNCFLASVAVACLLSTANCQNARPEAIEEEIRTKATLRTAVQTRSADSVADILSESDQIEALARGFRFEPGMRSQALIKTAVREGDRDVVTMKGIAKSALITGDVGKLAAVMVLFTLEKRDPDLEGQLMKILSDKKLMEAVVNADPAKEFLPPGDKERLSTDSKSEASTLPLSDGGVIVPFPGRKLQCDGCSPVNSYVCANCWAIDVCWPYHWC